MVLQGLLFFQILMGLSLLPQVESSQIYLVKNMNKKQHEYKIYDGRILGLNLG